MRNSAFIALGLMITLPAFGSTVEHGFCFPENNLNLDDGFFLMESSMTESKFNETIDKVSSFYAGIVAAHDATLSFDRKWTDSTVNASAHQDGNSWVVSMYGGLARRPEITEDGFAMVVCHELGHHLGGFPFKGDRWAASEGQADYFSAQACARKIWANDQDVNATFRDTAPPSVLNQCNRAFTTVDAQNICYRTAMAGKSLATLLATIGHQPEPKFETPDPFHATQNVETHPAAQCRMDTYLGGALCTKTFPDDKIPGRMNTDGQASVSAESIASQDSCTDVNMISLGRRPRCWYAPKLTLKFDVANMKQIEVQGNGNASWDPGETFGINIPLVNNLKTQISGAALSIAELSTNTSANYPSISPGSSAMAASQIEGQMPANLRCGDRFSLKPTVKIGQWQEQTTLNFAFGHHVTEEQIADSISTTIPDMNAVGITRVLQGVSTKLTNLVRLKINITHTNIGDLIVSLKSPSGHDYMIHNRQGGQASSIIKTFDVEVVDEPIAGAWTLAVSDVSRGDIGEVNSWGLEFTTASCDAGVSFVDETP